jgi:hypothetical protein
MRYLPLVLATILGLATPSLAEEQRTTLGVLTCTLAKATEAGGNNVMCGFKALGDSVAEERYVGTVRGLAQPAVGKQVLIWSVLGPSATKPAPGFLAQRYARAKAPGHPPAWVGETNSTIALRFETHEGAEIGNAITELELKLGGTSA